MSKYPIVETRNLKCCIPGVLRPSKGTLFSALQLGGYGASGSIGLSRLVVKGALPTRLGLLQTLSKVPLFEVPGSKMHQRYAIWSQDPQILFGPF